MRRGISHNAGSIYQAMRRRQRLVTSELSSAAVKIKLVLVSETRSILKDRIYDVEIPFNSRATASDRRKYAGTRRQTKGGKPIRKWRRSGELGRRETGRTQGPHVILFNPTVYATARYRLGTAQGRNIVTPGVQSVQWHHEAIQKHRNEILKLRREAILRALTRR